MSNDFDNTNRGVLFKNDKDGNEKRPDYTGKIDVNGKEYRLSAWIRKGQRGSFMSLSVQEPGESKKGGQRPKVDSGGSRDPNDDIPFGPIHKWG